MIKNFKVKKDKSHYKFDRAYMKKNESNFIPFSKGSHVDRYEDYYYACNRKIYNYIERFLIKNVGNNINNVFSKFSKLNFRDSIEMYDQWDLHIENEKDCQFYIEKYGIVIGFYADENNILRYNKWCKKYDKQYVSFTNGQLKHNDSQKIKSFGKVKNNPNGNLIKKADTIKYMSDFYVIYKDEVLKLPVYNIPFYYGGYNKIGSDDYIRNKNINDIFKPISIPIKKGYLNLSDNWYDYYSGQEKVVDENGVISYIQKDVIGNLGYGKMHPHIIIQQAEKEYEKVMFKKRIIEI